MSSLCDIRVCIKATLPTVTQGNEKIQFNSKISPIWKQRNLYRIVSNEMRFVWGSKKITDNGRPLLYFSSGMKCWLQTYSLPSPLSRPHPQPPAIRPSAQRDRLDSDSGCLYHVGSGENLPKALPWTDSILFFSPVASSRPTVHLIKESLLICF